MGSSRMETDDLDSYSWGSDADQLSFWNDVLDAAGVSGLDGFVIRGGGERGGGAGYPGLPDSAEAGSPFEQ